MIERVKIHKTLIEEVLNPIDKNWKRRTLYRWQWDNEDREELDPRKIYDLSGFESYSKEGLLVFRQGTLFVVEKPTSHFKNVISNIEPPTEYKWIYNPKETQRNVTVNSIL